MRMLDKKAFLIKFVLQELIGSLSRVVEVKSAVMVNQRKVTLMFFWSLLEQRLAPFREVLTPHRWMFGSRGGVQPPHRQK